VIDEAGLFESRKRLDALEAWIYRAHAIAQFEVERWERKLDAAEELLNEKGWYKEGCRRRGEANSHLDHLKEIQGGLLAAIESVSQDFDELQSFVRRCPQAVSR